MFSPREKLIRSLKNFNELLCIVFGRHIIATLYILYRAKQNSVQLSLYSVIGRLYCIYRVDNSWEQFTAQIGLITLRL